MNDELDATCATTGHVSADRSQERQPLSGVLVLRRRETDQEDHTGMYLVDERRGTRFKLSGRAVEQLQSAVEARRTILRECWTDTPRGRRERWLASLALRRVLAFLNGL